MVVVLVILPYMAAYGNEVIWDVVDGFKSQMVQWNLYNLDIIEIVLVSEVS